MKDLAPLQPRTSSLTPPICRHGEARSKPTHWFEEYRGVVRCVWCHRAGTHRDLEVQALHNLRDVLRG